MQRFMGKKWRDMCTPIYSPGLSQSFISMQVSMQFVIYADFLESFCCCCWRCRKTGMKYQSEKKCVFPFLTFNMYCKMSTFLCDPFLFLLTATVLLPKLGLSLLLQPEMGSMLVAPSWCLGRLVASLLLNFSFNTFVV